MKRVILFGLLGGLLATSTGCGLCQAIFCYHPCVNRCDGNMGCDGCDEGCGQPCGPPARAMRATGCGCQRARVCADCGGGCQSPCAQPCGSMSCGSCDPCADPCGQGCYGRPWHRGPLSCVFALFSPCCWHGPNCGQRYWGDFYSDPPDCNDPCDNCGNYAGNGNMNNGYMTNGYMSNGGGSGGGGCRSCGGGGRSMNGGSMGGNMMPQPSTDSVFDNSESMPAGEMVDRTVGPTPTPANQPHRAVRPSPE